jgi:hypothetical protein
VTPPTRAQILVCERFGATPDAPAPASRVGVARNLRDSGVWPLNGLRHPPERGTNGWYFWRGGEPGLAADFFQPLHAEHLPEWSPDVMPYLALPPGWRFLLAPDHEDVWYDPDLLRI